MLLEEEWELASHHPRRESTEVAGLLKGRRLDGALCPVAAEIVF